MNRDSGGGCFCDRFRKKLERAGPEKIRKEKDQSCLWVLKKKELMTVVLKAQDAMMLVGKQVKFTEWEMHEDEIIAKGNI